MSIQHLHDPDKALNNVFIIWEHQKHKSKAKNKGVTAKISQSFFQHIYIINKIVLGVVLSGK